ncbi:MAG: Rieske 2Fe-2S domain-containing protein, partial [Candidatus Heimdallarchaeota archaeon]|nr:Rieske 2Fe-2S domain-containing protein [Candidatus Heimdallarchaeota archaeon]
MRKFSVDDDITNASTISAEIYKNEDLFNLAKQAIFYPSWQYVADFEDIKVPGQVYPFTLFEGYMNEPLLMSRDFNDTVHALSNVCTHRGNIVVEDAGNYKNLRCRYHGKKFGIDGCFAFMPEFDDASGFPSEFDNLPKVSFQQWKKFFFISIGNGFGFDELISEMDKRVGWLPIEEFVYDANRSRDYLVNANWALYCDNYLEGFHIPYVHPSLNEVLDYGSYTAEIYKYSNLQIGFAESGEEIFKLPKDSVDYGKNIGAYYYWLWPNMMFNFYPWGLSINIVRPINLYRTKVSFKTYVWKPELLDKGAGAGLDRVEREDETI